MLNENICSWVSVGISVFLVFCFFFKYVHFSVYKALLPTAYNRNSQFKWHNEQIYAIQLLCH